MSTTSKKQRQRKSDERIIPIVIEDDDDNLSKETTKKDAEEITLTSASSTANVTKELNTAPSPIVTSDITEDSDNISSSVNQMELSDNSEMPKETETESKLPERMLPPYNVPEKIIIILDRAEDEISTAFELPNGKKLKPLNMLKDALKFFLETKSSFNTKHVFALMTLNENSTSWICDFTDNVHILHDEISLIEECHTEDIFDMTTVFETINSKIRLPLLKSDLMIPPPFVVRAIFLYNRSITMPKIKISEEITNLLESPYFTFDVAMTHEVPDSSNKCNLIFNELQQFDKKGYAYFFPIIRNAPMLYVAMAKLLSHPLQRCRQKDANYKLY